MKSKLQFYDKKEGKSQTNLEDSLQEKNIEETFIQWQQELLFQFNVAIQVLSKHTSNITKTRSQDLDEYFILLKAVIKDLKYDKPLGTCWRDNIANGRMSYKSASALAFIGYSLFLLKGFEYNVKDKQHCKSKFRK